MINMKEMIGFLTELERNNNREWYHAHKKERVSATQQFEALIQELILEIGKFDNSVLLNNPKDLTFKLVRDTRFSADKSPYNPVFRAHISSKGKLPIPVGYFLYLKPNDATFIGGGLFADMFKNATEMVRDYIVKHGSELEDIVKAPAFTSNFKLLGSQLKNVPRGYGKEHPQGEYLKYKSWFLEYGIPDAQLLDSDLFIKQAAEKFQLMKPFNDYLNKALVGFEMPSR